MARGTKGNVTWVFEKDQLKNEIVGILDSALDEAALIGADGAARQIKGRRGSKKALAKLASAQKRRRARRRAFADALRSDPALRAEHRQTLRARKVGRKKRAAARARRVHKPVAPISKEGALAKFVGGRVGAGGGRISRPGESPTTQLGILRSSIATTPSRLLHATIGTELEYGKWLELGTSIMGARPWLFRGVKRARKAMWAAFSREALCGMKRIRIRVEKLGR